MLQRMWQEIKFSTTKTSAWFAYCSNLIELGSRINEEYVPNDLRNLNTSNVTSMSSMFRECNQLTSLEVENFDTSNVTDAKGMFSRVKYPVIVGATWMLTESDTGYSGTFTR